MFEPNLHPYIFPFRLVRTGPLYTRLQLVLCTVPDVLTFSVLNSFWTGVAVVRPDQVLSQRVLVQDQSAHQIITLCINRLQPSPGRVFLKKKRLDQTRIVSPFNHVIQTEPHDAQNSRTSHAILEFETKTGHDGST